MGSKVDAGPALPSAVSSWWPPGGSMTPLGLASSQVMGTLHPLGWQEKVGGHMETPGARLASEPGTLQRGLQALGDGVLLILPAWLWPGLGPSVGNEGWGRGCPVSPQGIPAPSQESWGLSAEASEVFGHPGCTLSMAGHHQGPVSTPAAVAGHGQVGVSCRGGDLILTLTMAAKESEKASLDPAVSVIIFSRYQN